MVPVLGAVPIDTLVWVILILIGVISSIVSNARKAVKAARTAAPRVMVRPAHPDPGGSNPSVTLSLSQDVTPPVVVRQALRDTRAAQTPHETGGARRDRGGTGAFRGMFERGSLVRAIVAAEVLGPPKALQEQSIWSPRHSEPSI